MTYLDLLNPWPAAVRQYLYRFPNKTEIACYGPGNHGHWSLQANTTAASAFAVLATDPNFSAEQSGMSEDEMMNWALSMIRFTLSTHHSGNQKATDGQSWGHSWISGLCLERMMHAVEALDEFLLPEDRDSFQKVLLSEADWLLDHYRIVAGPVENNKPESNIWNGCLLYRAAFTLPSAARAPLYREKGTAFLVNGISKESDANQSEMIKGKPLSEWHVGGNMTPEMGCNHHGYQNVGYMAICLSNIAIMHFSCKAQGWEIPEGLYHHAPDLWKVVKACTFDDGRLFRIGGDTRVRYCYCQDYAIPTWLWARDYLEDKDTLTYEQGWKKQLKTEMASNADGSFLSKRLVDLKKVSPLYYLRLEGDRACTVSMGAYWNRKYGLNQACPETRPKTLQSWRDEYHGSLLSRDENRMASWTWRAADAPQGLVVPSLHSSMSEWQGNLAGRIKGVGLLNTPTCSWEQAEHFEGGFATCGKVTVRTHASVAEGELDTEVAHIEMACVALPDDCTVVVLQKATALNRPYLKEVKGLFLQIGNDIFNGSQRVLHTETGQQVLKSRPGEEDCLNIPGDWLNMDDQLSVVKVYGDNLSLYRSAERQVGIQPKNGRLEVLAAKGHYYVEEICCGLQTEVTTLDPNTELFDLGAVILTGKTAEQTRHYMKENPPLPLPFDHSELRGLQMTDAQGKTHRIIVNFSNAEIKELDECFPANRVVIR